MTPRRKKRLYLVALVLIGVAGATALFLTAFQENIILYHSPTEVAEGKVPEGRKFRVGGLVKEGSVDRSDENLKVRFTVTDTAHDVPIVYDGVLPDLFKEGQGIVANGTLNGDGVFVAEKVLAKHDENYMPPEVAESLEKAGAKPPHSMANEGK
jgi:cytochrome c-type biogenesis protein CcmE